MTHKLLLEGDPHQIRAAVLEEDRLAELFVERRDRRGVVGNVYQGRVNRVLPGMQAAFVDIGLERDAFLYVSDVREGLEALEDLEIGEAEVEGMAGLEGGEEPSIEELLTPGQEVIVQVVKDPMPNKGARITTYVTLPGRYLVYLPTVRHFGVSRRIEDAEERQRLRGSVEAMAPEAGGFIVRTAGEGRGAEEFASDGSYLVQLWERIVQRAGSNAAPALLHEDLDLALRVVRDLFGPGFDALWVEGEEIYERVLTFLDEVQPGLVGRVKLFEQDVPLFERFGIEEEIKAALESKVWLKSGGYIVIHPTEALVAIDVNTGRYVGRTTLEETVVRTNLEAVREIVRQIRVRNLGGIIVIDFIDMEEADNRREVFAALEQELKKDRSRNKVLNISDFGLVELTRKRSRPSLERMLTQVCPYCTGRGRIKSVATICLELRRQILSQRHRWQGAKQLLVRVHPEISSALEDGSRAVLEELERTLGLSIQLQGDPELHHERFDILEI